MDNGENDRIPVLIDSDLPALYQAADASSVRAQRRFLRLIRSDLVLLIVAAVVSSWATSSLEMRELLAVAGAVALISGFALTQFIQSTEPERVWYGGRAIAESVKTSAWRYAVGAMPYGLELDDQDADDRFLNELRQILKQRQSLGIALAEADKSVDQITGRMREIRSLALSSRLRAYLSGRVQDQRQWYTGKATTNSRLARKWLALVSGAQLTGGLFAALLIWYPTLPLNLASVFAATAATFLAWLQVKQFRDLASAYALTSPTI